MPGPTIAISTQTDSMSSVEIKDRAKGSPALTVKVYIEPGREEEAAQKAVEIHKRLTAQYAWMDGTSKLPMVVKPTRHDQELHEAYARSVVGLDPAEKGEDDPFN